jgi:hypothetical protein
MRARTVSASTVASRSRTIVLAAPRFLRSACSTIDTPKTMSATHAASAVATATRNV